MGVPHSECFYEWSAFIRWFEVSPTRRLQECPHMSCRCFAGCFFVCAIGIVGYAHAQTTQLWDSEIRKAASKEASVPPFLEQPFAPLLRDDKTLRMETLNAALPILLESQSRLQPALYLAARTAPGTAMPILERAFRESKDTRDKVGAAIAIRRFGRDAAAATLKKLAGMVEDKEAADWATVLSLDAEGGEIPAETRELDRGNSYFDEVIPLEISLDVFVPQEDGVVHSITLSPHDVRSGYGQAHACTNFNSRDSRLVIAKHLKLKDRLHVEGFLFKGMTFHPAEHRGVVNFLSESKRLLFLSGTILDRSAGTLEAEMRVVRAATWSAPTPRTWTGTAPVRFAEEIN